jgi:hypothetical protein
MGDCRATSGGSWAEYLGRPFLLQNTHKVVFNPADTSLPRPGRTCVARIGLPSFVPWSGGRPCPVRSCFVADTSSAWPATLSRRGSQVALIRY